VTKSKQPGVKPARVVAVEIVAQLLQSEGSLASLLPAAIEPLAPENKRLVQELCYGCCRWHSYLEAVLQLLLTKPLKKKDSDIKALLLLGLYQLEYTRIADHAAINESVNITRTLKKVWASKLVNGVLRRYQREKSTLLDTVAASSNEALFAHPKWLIDAIGDAWPVEMPSIMDANNQHPPFTLRVNQRKVTRDDYLSQLAREDIAATPTPHSHYGITLAKGCPVTALPGFSEGWCSVQDEAAQLSAGLLDLQPGMTVLDACCAPGGKTCHIAETQPSLKKLVALDVERRRLPRVVENLTRLKLEATVVCGDAGSPQSWWEGEPFDRILVDAPCSATGIIRRQPDIKLLRRPEHIAQLVQQQERILQQLWPLLAVGGRLLYATCSILPAENTGVIEQFLRVTTDAKHEPIIGSWGIEQPCGRQLLPTLNGHDGFYYACLSKHSGI